MVKSRLNRRTAYIVAILLIAGAALLYSLSYGVGSLSEPGPGIWPTIGSTVMLLGAVILLFPGRDSLEEYDPFTRNILYIAYGLAIAIVWLLLAEYVGVIIATFSFFYIWLTLISRESQKVVLPISVVGAFVVYFLFDVGLRAPFPEGFLERLIGL